MSAGHRHGEKHPKDHDHAHEILKDPNVRKHLSKQPKIDKSHDIPYLAGYSRDGKTVYLDRHFPEVLEINGQHVNAHEFVAIHERCEKAAIDAQQKNYEQAHKFATTVEHSALEAHGINPGDYEKALAPYIKAAEHEKIERIPPDLDMTPYYPKYAHPSQLLKRGEKK